MLLETPFRQIAVLAATALLISLLGFLGYRAKPGKHGWRQISPGPMHWTALVLGGGLALLFLYIRLFVGSSRPDAESQMNSLTGLIIAFTIGVALTAWSTLRIHRMAFEWRGRAIAFTNGKDERVDWSIDDLSAVRRSRLGWFVLTFADASTAKLDVQARGSVEFIAIVAERRPDLFPRQA